jgi:hypothetical protein
VREQPQRKTGGGEFYNSGAVAQKSRGVASVGVTERAEFFVVTSDESWAGANAARSINEATIDAKTKVGHGIRFIDIGVGEKFSARGAKNLLCKGKNGAGILATSGGVQQTEEHALGTDANGIVEVAGYAFAGENSGNVCALNRGEERRDRLHYGCGLRGVRMK